MKITTSIPPVFERDLQRGMKHSDVKRLQQLLNLDPDTQVAKTGNGSPGRETKVYGKRTEDAVRRFQAKHGIISSGTPATTGYGRVGPKTRKAIIATYEYRPVTGKSKKNTSEIDETSSEIPAEALTALAWATNRLGKAFQPCENPGCFYNYGPKQKGEEACKNPTSKASKRDKEKNNHKNLHPYWFFHCARFVQHAYGVEKKGAAIAMYNELKRKGAVNKSSDVPEGAFVFWKLTKYGHVGICSGNGKVIHTGLKKTLREEGVREDLISKVSESTYLGWAYPTKDWLV